LTIFYCRFGHGDKFDKTIYRVRSSSLKGAISHVGALNGGTFRFEESNDKDVECLTEPPVAAKSAAPQVKEGAR